MRNFEFMKHFLYILLFFTITLIGCKSRTTSVTSSEARVNTFNFYTDTLNPGLTEATYKIDHNGDTGRIYCVDSLRFKTRLDKVIPYVTYKATPGSATFFLPDTTIVSTGLDTMNFNQSPIYLRVVSSDLSNVQWYKFDITVHQADPNLYVWDTLTQQILTQESYETKAFWLNNQLSVFVNNGFSTLLYQSNDGSNWKQIASEITTLPTPCYVRDIVQHRDTLYYIDNACLYYSTDLLTWSKKDYSNAAYSPVAMVLSYNNQPWCIVEDTLAQQLMLATIQLDSIYPRTDIEGVTNGYLPSTFPTSDFAALSFKASSERPRAMIVGGRDYEDNLVNSRWNLEYSSLSGYRIKNFSISQPTFESLAGVSIIQYDNHLMMFGGINSDATWKNGILYSDDEGMNWYVPDTTSNRLPYEANRFNQTVLVDDSLNIFIIGGQSNTQSYSDVYRGYLNSVKWE